MKAITLFQMFIFMCSSGWLTGCANLQERTEAGGKNPKVYSSAELKEDVDFLTETVLSVHPDFANAPDKAERFVRSAEALKKQLQNPMTQREFFIQIAPLLREIDDGHTRVELPFESLDDYSVKKGRFFPLDVLIQENSLFVYRDNGSEPHVEPGTDILAINGVPSSEIIQRIGALGVGRTLAARQRSLEGPSARFKQLLWICYGVGAKFNLEVMDHGIKKTIQVSGSTKKDLLEQYRKNYGPAPDYTFSQLDEKAALIDINTFDLNDRDYRKFLRSTFQRIRELGVEDLIIDVRNLGGSDGAAVELYSYIAREPFVITPGFEIRSSRLVKKSLKEDINAVVRWIPTQYFFDFTRRIWTAKEGEMLTIVPSAVDPKPSELRYNGKVYVLIAEDAFSIAALFARLVKTQDRGLLVGRETGSLDGIMYGQPVEDYMPNTGLSFWCAGVRLQFFGDESQIKMRGIQPDVFAERNLEEVIRGVDPVLKRAKEVIRSRNSAQSL